jgi:aminoglycoside phosphotransferase (APT) family kinase protein
MVAGRFPVYEIPRNADMTTADADNSRDEAAFARLARKIAPDAVLLRVWPLHGGVSARVTAFELEDGDGSRRTLVTRQHGAVDLARNPNIAADEFALLRVVWRAGIPVPEPVLVEPSGEVFSSPVLVVSYVDGESLFDLGGAPDLITQLATQLARIHRVDCSGGALAFLPRQEDVWGRKIANRPEKLDDSIDEGRIRDALEVAWPWPQRNASALLHGDYWPGNILWRAGRLAGILDWEDAALGDPLFDLANSRLEVLWAFGAEAMANFTAAYTSAIAIDLTNLPGWDLCAALRHGPNISALAEDATAEARMRARYHYFVVQALEHRSGIL